LPINAIVPLIRWLITAAEMLTLSCIDSTLLWCSLHTDPSKPISDAYSCSRRNICQRSRAFSGSKMLLGNNSAE